MHYPIIRVLPGLGKTEVIRRHRFYIDGDMLARSVVGSSSEEDFEFTLRSPVKKSLLARLVHNAANIAPVLVSFDPGRLDLQPADQLYTMSPLDYYIHLRNHVYRRHSADPSKAKHLVEKASQRCLPSRTVTMRLGSFLTDYLPASGHTLTRTI